VLEVAGDLRRGRCGRVNNAEKSIAEVKVTFRAWEIKKPNARRGDATPQFVGVGFPQDQVISF
jgi:hypothetical protein